MAFTHDDKIRDNFKRAKIVVIEDNADHCFLIQKAIKQCIPEVMTITINQPEEAISLLREWNKQEWELPQLIIQDLYLPTREDGWRLLKQIKGVGQACSRIPLIMLSSSSDQSDIEEGYRNGISSYLVKPVDFEHWLTYFQELRAYWWETVTLPPIHFS